MLKMLKSRVGKKCRISIGLCRLSFHQSPNHISDWTTTAKKKKKNSSASCFIYNFVFQVISEKHCVAKILLAIWEIF